MIARGLLISLAVELAIYVWLGLRLADAHGTAQAVLAVAGIAVAFRAGIVLLTYTIAFATPGRSEGAKRIGPVAMAGDVLREIAAFAVLFTVIQPFVRWIMGKPDRAMGPPDGKPLLLVHGYLCNRGLWRHLAPKLAAAGYRVHTIDLEPGFGSIDAFARQLAARLDAVRGQSPGRPVTLVGHSMGGLVIRACLRDRGGDGIAAAVTLGTPHHGTSLAAFGLGQNAKEMRLRSAWLTALAAAERGASPVPVASIYSWQDNFISPQRSSRFETAENEPVCGVGHLTMAFSKRIRERLFEALARLERRA